jgi:hypothetical protein
MNQCSDQNDFIRKKIADNNLWTDDCLKYIHRITMKFKLLHGYLAEAQNESFSKRLRKQNADSITHLQEMFENDILLYDDLEKSLSEFRSKKISKALEYIEIANAYHLEPITVRGETFLTGTEAVFKLADFVRSLLVRIKLRASLWKQSEINEQLIRESVSEIFEIHQMLEPVDSPLLRKLKSQLRVEHIRCERWLSDLYGLEKQASEDLAVNDMVFTEGQLQVLFGLKLPGIIHVCISKIDGLQLAERGTNTFHFTLDQTVQIARELLKSQTDSSIKENATEFIRAPQQYSSRMLSFQ